MTQLIIAIDVGTSGVRAMLFDATGAVLSKAYEEFDSIFPSPSWVEQEAPNWWTTTCKVLTRVIKSGPYDPADIAGVSVTNQRETVVPIDESGKPLRRAIVWQDRRTVSECDWIRTALPPEEIYNITGLTIDPYFTAPKILWIKTHEPDLFKATHKFLLVHDFVIFKLTERSVTDYSNASRTMLFDITQARWSDKILDEFGIPREKLPELVKSGNVVGEVSTAASELTGLAAGTPVVAGGGDQQCAALGVGVVREGMTKATTGTGTFMLTYSNSPRLDPKRRLLCSRHVVDGAFVVEASMFTTGSALRWFRDNLGVEERATAEKHGIDPYEVLAREAGSIPPGSEGVIHIPHFVGAGAPYWNPHARGVFAGLALGHTRPHLIRAILEGVSYELRTNLEVVRSLGLEVSEMRVTGGAARSEIWMQIQADVLGVPVIRTQIEEATALGAAILASVGVGIFKSMNEAAEEMVRTRPPLLPTPKNRAIYDTGFERYRRVYAGIADIHWD
ncbi:MAG: xylulokinase [Candidatus Thorarchaeota archaeon]|nr:xylulokinase [Candidatus Thorarchaeota archaeon]